MLTRSPYEYNNTVRYNSFDVSFTSQGSCAQMDNRPQTGFCSLLSKFNVVQEDGFQDYLQGNLLSPNWLLRERLGKIQRSTRILHRILRIHSEYMRMAGHVKGYLS